RITTFACKEKKKCKEKKQWMSSHYAQQKTQPKFHAANWALRTIAANRREWGNPTRFGSIMLTSTPIFLRVRSQSTHRMRRHGKVDPAPCSTGILKPMKLRSMAGHAILSEGEAIKTAIMTGITALFLATGTAHPAYAEPINPTDILVLD